MPPPDFLHGYVPVWDAQREAITAYRATSRLDQPAGKSFGSHAQFEQALTVSRIASAARSLAQRLEAGDRLIMWVPLAYDVLASTVGRMKVAGACRTLPSQLRPYLIFEISDLPEGVPQSRLSELVGSLRPFCRGVAAAIPARTASFSAFSGGGLQAIGLSLLNDVLAEVTGRIAELHLAAKKQGMQSFLMDVPQGQLLHTARGLGINLMSSPLIGLALPDPAAIHRLSARSISSRSDSSYLIP